MTKKDAVLARLRCCGDASVSGQMLAQELGISRAAVWKIIKTLQGEGYEIEAVSNRGYRLMQTPDRLSADELRAALPELEIDVLETVDSTNTEAKRRLVSDVQKPMLLAAEAQTGGRGRQGRSFYSPAGTGIYMTLAVHPNAALTDAVSVTTRASVAVCRAIRTLTDAEPQIKWVNDLYLGEKKLCGILVEAISDFETGITKSLIIGVGVNVSTTDFPDLPQACSLQQKLDRNALIIAIAKELLKETADLRDKSYLADYRKWSMVIGREIVFIQNGVQKAAKAIEIDENGGLIVETIDGSCETLQSGEITLRVQ